MDHSDRTKPRAMRSGKTFREWPVDPEPFGDRGSSDERMQFAGQEREIGDPSATTDDLDFMHARRYNMHLSRFLAPDPVAGDPRNPQSFNPYAYAFNNPLRYLDPWGMAGEDINGTTNGSDQDSAAGDEQISYYEQLKAILADPEFRKAITDSAVMLYPVLLPRAAGGGTPVHTALVVKPAKLMLNEIQRPWQGHPAAHDAVTVLSGGLFFLQTFNYVSTSTQIVAEQAVLPAMATEGGIGSGFLNSGLGVFPSFVLVAGTGWAAWEVGSVLRRDVLPQKVNDKIGDVLYDMIVSPPGLPYAWQRQTR